MKARGGPGVAVLVFVMVGCILVPPRPLPMPTELDIQDLSDQADAILDYIEGNSVILPDLYDAPIDGGESLLGKGLRMLAPIQIAYAQAKGISPAMKDAIQSLRARHNALQEIKTRGFAGENYRGYPEILDNDSQDPEEKNAAQRVVAAETKNRKKLYNEIVRINEEQALNVSTIERIYAQRRLERGKPAEHFQLPPAGADFDSFKESNAGIRLGEGCIAETWVTLL